MKLSVAFHPKTNGQEESTIQILVDMLREFMIDFKGIWDDHLPLIEFSYNNSYHSSIGMAPFEALYGRRCMLLFDCLKWVRLCFFVPILFKDFGEISYHKEPIANVLWSEKVLCRS